MDLYLLLPPLSPVKKSMEAARTPQPEPVRASRPFPTRETRPCINGREENMGVRLGDITKQKFRELARERLFCKPCTVVLSRAIVAPDALCDGCLNTLGRVELLHELWCESCRNLPEEDPEQSDREYLVIENLCRPCGLLEDRARGTSCWPECEPGCKRPQCEDPEPE